MSNYPFLNHQSPVNRKPPEPTPIGKPPASSILVRPTSIKTARNPITSQNARPLDLSQNVNSQRSVSPIKSFPLDERKMPPQYNYPSILAYKKEQSNMKNDMNAPQSYNSRDSSPLGRIMWYNAPQRYFPPNFGNGEKPPMIAKDGSWDRLLKRPEEQAMQKDQRLTEWRRLLEEQIREKQARKQAEEERRRNEEMQYEHRYQRQIQQLTRDVDTRKFGALSSDRKYPEEQYQTPIPQKQMNYYPLSQQQERGNMKYYQNPLSHRENRVMHESREDNARARRGKSFQRDEDFSWKDANYSVEKDEPKPQTDRLNHYIDSLREEILQSQKIFKNEIKELTNEVYKSARFRNVAEKNLLGGQKGGYFQAGSGNLHINPTFDNTSANNPDKYFWRLPSQKPKDGIVRPNRNMTTNVIKDEEKLQLDNYDFYSKLNNMGSKRFVEVQTMVKIQPVTEELLAYKDPEGSLEVQKELLKQKEDEVIKAREIIKNQDNGAHPVPGKLNHNLFKKSFSRAESLSSIHEDPAKQIEEAKQAAQDQEESIGILKKELNKLPSLMFENKDGSRIISRANSQGQDELERHLIKSSSRKELNRGATIQINVLSPKDSEKGPSEDILKINENLHTEIKEAGTQNRESGTPSASQSQKEHSVSKKASVDIFDLTQGQEKPKGKTRHLGRQASVDTGKLSEGVLIRPTKKKPSRLEKDSKIQNIKGDGSLKALSKFVSKDGIDPKLFYENNGGKDPLARLDAMIQYLYNNPSES